MIGVACVFCVGVCAIGACTAMDKQVKNPITEGVIYKQLLVFFFPILLGTFFQQLYNTADAIIVGKFVGKVALGAVGGSTGTIINLLVGFFTGLSSGATVIISQHYGAKREKATEQSVHTALALAVSCGLAITIIGLVFGRMALEAMETPSDILPFATSYLNIYFSGMVFSMIYNIGCGILRAVGDSRRPLYFLIFCTLLNVVLDLLFVLVLQMSVAGVAIATILSQAVSALLVMRRLCRASDIYKVSLRKIRFYSGYLKNIVVVGLPAGIQSALYGISNIILQAAINNFQTDTVAAWTAYGKIDGLFWMIMGAYGVSVTTFAGQNFGAGKIDRVKKSLGVGVALAMGSAVLISTIVLIFGRYIIKLFNDDTEVIRLGIEIIKTLAPFYFTYVLIEMVGGVLRGTGDAVLPMIITCFGVCGLRMIWIKVIAPLNPVLPMLLYSYPVTWSVTSCAFLIYYFHGGWLKRRLRKNVSLNDLTDVI